MSDDLSTRFILHWGEMSSRWGINRSVAQIHALLFLSKEPLNAEQISDVLGLARSNVSNSLREVQAFGVVRVVHRIGDRRDYFESEKDVWAMVRAIIEHRKKREVDPTLDMLSVCVRDAENSDTDEYTLNRMKELQELLESMARLFDQVSTLPLPAQKKVLKMGGKIRKLGTGKA
ncbi:MAG: ArsR family transcriptional regulator [Gammaproteobacteria bacterium]|nr:ArsR family transcriptional regulator [Gammaproteobacteria bacterium]